MIRDGVDGLIYPHKEIAVLANKIESLIIDRSLSLSLGKNAREISLERHDPSRIAELTMAMYQEVISSERV